MDVVTLAKLIDEKKISPIEIAQQKIEEIRNENEKYNIFLTVNECEVMEAARKAEQELLHGERKSVFHGVPVAVKDMIFTKGIRTTMGSKIYKDYVPTEDATVIQKLKEAGALILGKVHTHEFAYGPIGDKSYFGSCRNPYNPEKITGGSSSGSGAALAANMAYAALGTDTGGSVRIPASACSVVGMKPTFGRVSKRGVFDLAYTLDHVGPMTKTVRDNALLLNILAGYDSQDPYSKHYERNDFTSNLGTSIEGKIIGLPSYYFKQVEEEVSEAIERVIEVYTRLGAHIQEVTIDVMEEIATAQTLTIQSEAAAVHARNLKTRKTDYDAEVLERLLLSQKVRGYEYVSAQQKRTSLIHRYNEVFSEVDVLLTPTLPVLPPDLTQREVIIAGEVEAVRHALLRLTAPTNYTGNPGLSVPCGFSKQGLPIGFQLIGNHGEESLLYQIGEAYEQYKE